MKRLFTKVKQSFIIAKKREEYLKVFSNIRYFTESNIKVHEIELFLDIRIDDYDEVFIQTYFSKYEYLYEKLNIMTVIIYISFIEELKTKVIKDLLKKLLYPFVLLTVAIVTLFIFKHSLIRLLNDFITPTLTLLVNIFYFLSILAMILLFIGLIIVLIVHKNNDKYLMLYNLISHKSILSIIEVYYIKIITYLLLIAYKDGMSTSSTMMLLRNFKGEPIVSNIAFYLTSDLEDGLGLDKSIRKMKTSKGFKRILTFAIQSDNYEHFLNLYNKQLDSQLEAEITKISKVIYTIAYVYIGLLIILFYKILGLPLSMIDSI